MLFKKIRFLAFLQESNSCLPGNNLLFEKKKLKDNFFFSNYA